MIKGFVQNILMKIGVRIARWGGLDQAPWDKSLQGFAHAGYVCWEQYNLNPDDLYSKVSKTAIALSGGNDTAELRMAVARELWARRK